AEPPNGPQHYVGAPQVPFSAVETPAVSGYDGSYVRPVNTISTVDVAKQVQTSPPHRTNLQYVQPVVGSG
ncbi:hypothetical protein BG003_001579, partial [Podila horticola]